MTLRAAFLLLLAALAPAGCGSTDEGTLTVGVIDREEALFAEGVRLSSGAQHLRGALRSGLVTLDAQGDVAPALADRWNVTDDGRIFVFRLRDGTWPNGEDLTAETVRVALNRAIRDLRGTSLGLDLAPIEEIRAMAGRVVEIRLSSAVPALLQLLAQPELALTRGNGGTGPMVLAREDGHFTLTMKPPEERGLPEEEDWREDVREIDLRPLSAQQAIDLFDEGELDVVLGGDLGSWPLADTGPLSRGTVRLDPAIGLFGLHVLHSDGMLAEEALREALAMAIDRPALVAPFNIGGWTPTTRIVSPDLPNDTRLILERWAGQNIDQRRARAAGRIARWRQENESVEGEDLTLTLAIDETPGHELLLRELARQFATVGVALVRAEGASSADLALVDRVARYAGGRWFLNQFNCGITRGLCDEDADYLVGQTVDDADPQRRAYLLAEAEAELTMANVYLPFGSPLRWSLVRGTVDGYAANRWAFHPLPEMAVIPR